MAKTRERPTMASHRLDLPNFCDICGKARSTRTHERCSQLRQKRKSVEWDAYMANIQAKGARFDHQNPDVTVLVACRGALPV